MSGVDKDKLFEGVWDSMGKTYATNGLARLYVAVMDLISEETLKGTRESQVGRITINGERAFETTKELKKFIAGQDTFTTLYNHIIENADKKEITSEVFKSELTVILSELKFSSKEKSDIKLLLKMPFVSSGADIQLNAEEAPILRKAERKGPVGGMALSFAAEAAAAGRKRAASVGSDASSTDVSADVSPASAGPGSSF